MRIILISAILLFCLQVKAQWGLYQKPVEDVNETWQRVEIPYTLFDSLRADLGDIRLYAISISADTLVIPYYIESRGVRKVQVQLPVEQINQGPIEDGWSFTLMVDSALVCNRMELDLGQSNFFYNLKLSGSQDQQNWQTLLADYQLVAVKNDWTNYRFTEVNFSPARYLFYRVELEGSTTPRLRSAHLSFEQRLPASYYSMDLDRNMQTSDYQNGRRIITYDLPYAVPVNSLTIHLLDSTDYHRDFEIWTSQHGAGSDQAGPAVEDFRYLTKGTLSSKHTNTFHFNKSTVRQLKLVVYENDNQPLTVGNIKLRYPKQQLVGRFPPAQYYFMSFGNKELRPPKYDLIYFKADTLTNFPIARLGSSSPVGPAYAKGPSQWWLWVVLLAILITLGRFAWRLIKDPLPAGVEK